MMAISLKSLNRIDTPRPPRIVLYGPHGVGKNTFAATAPKPVLIDIEDGHPANMPIDAFPKAKTFDDVMGALAALASEDHDFQTVVIDSIDWMEQRIVWPEAIARNNRTPNSKQWASIEDAGYGKGYMAAVDVWREYLEALDYLRDEKGMAIIQIAHAEVKRFESPETDPYDAYQIKLHKMASALIQEHADMVLFANFKVSVKSVDTGMKKITRGVGAGIRALYTEKRPAFAAKNRHGLPPELPFEWAALEAAMAPEPTAKAA